MRTRTIGKDAGQSPVVIPIPGSSRPETIRDSAQAADPELTGDEVARLMPPADRSGEPDHRAPGGGPLTARTRRA